MIFVVEGFGLESKIKCINTCMQASVHVIYLLTRTGAVLVRNQT